VAPARHRLLLLVVALAAAAGTARLGVWQLDRAAQKNALQADLDARTALPPLTAQALAHDAAEADAQVHRRAELVGRWLPQHTVWLDNRQMDGRPGFFVLTPLALDDGSALLVQRGWQPRDFVDRSRVAAPPTPDGPVRVAGRLARDPARLYALGDEAAGPIRQNLVIDVFASETGLRLRPLTLLQTSPTDQDALRRDWPRPAAGVHTHYGYAFQWFSLSALIVGLYVWFQLVRPTRRA
jgi:surfeit locus 1 family protein